jgi:hypothetical protein
MSNYPKSRRAVRLAPRSNGFSGHEIGFTGRFSFLSRGSGAKNKSHQGCASQSVCRTFGASGHSVGLRRRGCRHASAANAANDYRLGQRNKHRSRPVDDAYVERGERNFCFRGSGNRKRTCNRQHVRVAGGNHHLSFHRDRKRRDRNHSADGCRRRSSHSHADTQSISDPNAFA